MFDYFWFWISKTLAEMTVGIGILLILVFGAVVMTFFEKLKQWRCEHSTYRENRACQAICTSCKKDLGFIADLRADKSRREV